MGRTMRVGTPFRPGATRTGMRVLGRTFAGEEFRSECVFACGVSHFASLFLLCHSLNGKEETR